MFMLCANRIVLGTNLTFSLSVGNTRIACTIVGLSNELQEVCQGTVNVPKLLANRVPHPSDTASLIMQEKSPCRHGLGKGLGQVLEQR